MKALYIHGPEDLREQEVPLPEPAAGQVRVRLAYAGICGSDLHYFFHGRNGVYEIREPMIPGHEVSGVVDLDPAGRLAPGTPVTIHPATWGRAEAGLEDVGRHLLPGGSYLGSASTSPHTHGGMVEQILVRADQIRELPAGLSLETAALAEPLGVAMHAVAIAGDLEGRSVLVSGAGPIGLLTLAAARAAGAARIVVSDLLPGPLERARALGADETVQIDLAPVTADSVDVAFECAAVAPSVSTCIAAVRRAGIVVQVGILPDEPIPVNLGPLVNKEAQYRGTFRFDEEITDAVALLARHPELAQVITHVVDASEARRAFDVARDSAISGKVLVSLWREQL
ncbi:L-idonate 5-dehydrogenase [Brachybacterium hainanense]|uniref:L-idonate 5-dehydrogenase n=1 Tax=Brachybacterium hainanense TaxID=1541174 RepID=A0ABV6REI3_9MICO